MGDTATLIFDPDRREVEAFFSTQLAFVGLRFDSIAPLLPCLYEKLAVQFLSIKNRYYRLESNPVLRLAHGAQSAIFLYELSRAAFLAGDRHLADRLYALLRMTACAEIFYEVDLPQRWGCDHPTGSVIGRGRFTPRSTFFFRQNCNVGNNRGAYPDIDGNLIMMPNSALLGKIAVTGNVILSHGACAIDAGLLSDCIVFGRSPNLTIKPLDATNYLRLSKFVQEPESIPLLSRTP